MSAIVAAEQRGAGRHLRDQLGVARGEPAVGQHRLFSKPTRTWPPSPAAVSTQAASRRPNAHAPRDSRRRGRRGRAAGRAAAPRSARRSAPSTNRANGRRCGITPRRRRSWNRATSCGAYRMYCGAIRSCLQPVEERGRRVDRRASSGISSRERQRHRLGAKLAHHRHLLGRAVAADRLGRDLDHHALAERRAAPRRSRPDRDRHRAYGRRPRRARAGAARSRRRRRTAPPRARSPRV